MWARKTIDVDQVVKAFHDAGIPLRPFTGAGAVRQLTWSTGKLIPAVVVSVFADERSARRADQGLTINGRRVRAIALHNVRIWVAAGAPGQARTRVTRALAGLRSS